MTAFAPGADPSLFDPPRPAVVEAVGRALAEDLLPLGDLTASLLDPAAQGHLVIAAREPGVIAGQWCAETAFARVGPDLKVDWRRPDGAAVAPGDVVATVSGELRAILTAERTALNFLQLLSGTATATRAYVEAVAGTRCQILDTRKTLPGLRFLEKYATRMGGATNHRMGLWDAAMIKDNHVAVAGGVGEAVARARAAGVTRIICEVDHLEQIEPAIAAGANHLLLDNMGPAMLAEAVAIIAGRAESEASGGVNLASIGAIAASGVDFVSVGRLTQSAPAADIGLDFGVI